MLTTKLLEWYDSTDSKERCGLILKGNRIVELINIHPDPTKGFEISVDSILKYEDKLKGTWHTHPNGINALSECDYGCFLYWPDLEHYIIGSNGVQKYIVKDGIVLNVD